MHFKERIRLTSRCTCPPKARFEPLLQSAELQVHGVVGAASELYVRAMKGIFVDE